MRASIDIKTAASKGLPNAPLQVTTQQGMLLIAVGVETLAWASEKENGGPLDCKVCNHLEFAKDVAREMEREKGDYEAQPEVSKWLDRMVEIAAESGSGAIEYP